MAKPDLRKLSFEAGAAFTRGAPIDELGLFAGRQREIEKILHAVRTC